MRVIVLAREVFACKCSTETALDDHASDEFAPAQPPPRFLSGRPEHLCLLDRAHHDPVRTAEFRARLARGEHWLLGLRGDRIVTYTWLHARARCEYPYLPGCAFELAPRVAYGYDAWTTPDLRGAGLRRRAFLEELRILRSAGMRAEASFFVAHQLEGAKRSLARAGIEVVPVWRVCLRKDRSLAFERLALDDALRPVVTHACDG